MTSQVDGILISLLPLTDTHGSGGLINSSPLFPHHVYPIYPGNPLDFPSFRFPPPPPLILKYPKAANIVYYIS